MPPVLVPAARPVFLPEDRAEILHLIDGALAHGALTLGPLTGRLEEEFAARHGVAHGVAVSSGTAALEIVLRCLGVDGRDVVVPANTFFATAAAVIHAGGRPRFADVDPTTMALSATTVEAALDNRCAGVVLVHIGGLVSPDVRQIADLCAQRGIFLVEDAAHAHGSTFAGRAAGSFGRAAAFSFYPTKLMTAGEGGIIVTDDEELRDEARVYRDQGKASFVGGEHTRLGYAWRMSELHAAVAVTQLARLDEFIAVRRRVAGRYDDALRDLTGIVPLVAPHGCLSNYYKYVTLLHAGIDRAALKQELRDEHGVALSGEVYARPLPREPVFAATASASCPVADDVCARQVCLPIHSDMTDGEADLVLEGLRAVLGRHG